MEDDMREELTDHFERTLGRPPAGAEERVLAGFRAAADRPPRRRVLEWSASAAAVVLALLVAGALVLSHLAPRPLPAGRQELPGPRSGAAVAYDASRHVVLLFGGTADGRTPLDDTWTWDGRGWARLRPPVSPPGLTGALMAYDAANGTIVLYAGRGPTWTWDGRAWSDHPTADPAGQPNQTAMAYDPATRTVLLYTTVSDTRAHQTWSWDGTTWTQLHPATGPDLVAGAMAFDGQRLLLVGVPFGMVQGQFVTETWTWDGSTWSQRSPAIRLPVSTMYSVAYDEARRRLVALIVPEGAGAAETWTWDGVTWAKEHPAHLPEPRYGAALVYDPAARAVLLYGGTGAARVALADVWTWDGGDWTLRKEATR